jgi:DNA-binding transcriptional ArsR family regulator
MLHALVRSGELCVSDLADAVAMKPQAVSNQLQRLTDRGILGSRCHGTNIFYRIVDLCVTSLLDLGLCLNEDADSRREVSRVVSPVAGSPSAVVSGWSEGT